MEDVHLTDFICKLLETRIMQILRFKHGLQRSGPEFLLGEEIVAYTILHISRGNIHGGFSSPYRRPPVLHFLMDMQPLRPSKYNVHMCTAPSTTN